MKNENNSGSSSPMIVKDEFGLRKAIAELGLPLCIKPIGFKRNKGLRARTEAGAVAAFNMLLMHTDKTRIEHCAGNADETFWLSNRA